MDSYIIHSYWSLDFILPTAGRTWPLMSIGHTHIKQSIMCLSKFDPQSPVYFTSVHKNKQIMKVKQRRNETNFSVLVLGELSTMWMQAIEAAALNEATVSNLSRVFMSGLQLKAFIHWICKNVTLFFGLLCPYCHRSNRLHNFPGWISGIYFFRTELDFLNVNKQNWPVRPLHLVTSTHSSNKNKK